MPKSMLYDDWPPYLHRGEARGDEQILLPEGKKLFGFQAEVVRGALDGVGNITDINLFDMRILSVQHRVQSPWTRPASYIECRASLPRTLPCFLPDRAWRYHLVDSWAIGLLLRYKLINDDLRLLSDLFNHIEEDPLPSGIEHDGAFIAAATARSDGRMTHFAQAWAKQKMEE